MIRVNHFNPNNNLLDLGDTCKNGFLQTSLHVREEIATVKGKEWVKL